MILHHATILFSNFLSVHIEFTQQDFDYWKRVIRYYTLLESLEYLYSVLSIVGAGIISGLIANLINK